MRPDRFFAAPFLAFALIAPTGAMSQGVVEPPDVGPPAFDAPFDLPAEPQTPDLLPAPPAPTEDAAEGDAASAPTTPAERLDRLFGELKRERDADAAAEIAGRIQEQWMESGSATTDLLMGWSNEAIAREDHAAALDLLDQIVVLDPDYAEVWNKRAALNYQLSRYGNSIADIEQTLAREPRHFGALTGLAAILETLGRKAEALRAYEEVLAVYPTLRSAQEAAGRLAGELSGQPT